MFSFLRTRYPRARVREGLTENTLNLMCLQCREQFGTDLPAGYRQFLTELNGFSFDGHSVFGHYDKLYRTANPRVAASDFLTNNAEFRAMTDIEDYLMLGSSSLDYLAYEISSGKYIVMSNGVMRRMKESISFAEIVNYFFTH